MIKSFKDKDLENGWRYDNCKSIKSDLKKRVVNKLHYMDAATCLFQDGDIYNVQLEQYH